MKRNLPAFFFLAACLLNWAGRLGNMPALAAAVKPALMPLLAASVLVYALSHRLNGRKLELLIAAELLGCVGDICLLKSSFPLFAGGIGAFLLGHLCYIAIFGREAWKGLDWKAWAGGLAGMLVLVAGLVKLLRIEGALLLPMAVYGFVLCLLMFSTLCGLLRLEDKRNWGLLFAGSVIFSCSDALIAAGTFHVLDFGAREFVIMFTYLVAQALLAKGTVGLARED